MYPDLGIKLWDAGAGDLPVVIVGVQWISLDEYDGFREITGFIYDLSDEHNSLGAYCVTLRTRQTRKDLARRMHHARVSGTLTVARGTVSAVVDVGGGSGERYRVLEGRLENAQDASDGEAEADDV